MYLYSLGNFGEVVNVELGMDRTVSLLWMSHHGLKLVSCLQVIFSCESNLKLVPSLQVNLPKGYGYVEFKARVDAEKAQLFMDGVGFSAMLE